MSLLVIALLFISSFSRSYAFFFGPKVYPPWNKLSMTFLKFSTMPMNENDAIKQGWKLSKDACKEATFFYGKRYIKNNDLSTMLLFDENGQIAGTQFAYSKNNIVAKNQIGKTIYDDGRNYYVTAYFIQPKTVCKVTKRKSDYVGDNLFLVTGPNDEFMKIPLKESDIKYFPKWIKGKCFLTMGRHYWYNISNDMSCDDAFPFFLLYNSDVLNGFGFTSFADIKSKRVEHPSQNLLWLFIDSSTMPKCVTTAKIRTTQHVYLQKRPLLNFC